MRTTDAEGGGAAPPDDLSRQSSASTAADVGISASTAEKAANDWQPTIWVAHCPFKKNGAPSLGTFGKSIGGVVVMRVETWTRLCREIPELGKQQFNVGHDA